MTGERSLKIMTSTPEMKVDYFSDEELIQIARRIGSEGDRIHKTERKRFLLLFKFLLRTGARVSEALLISPRDIDLNLNAVRLTTLKKKKGKNRELPRRTVNLHQDLRDTYMQYLLEAHIDQSSNQRLFPMTRQRVDKFFKSICGPDIKFHAHKLRHTFAVNAVRAGIPLNVLQAWLGHSSIFTTSIYTQIAGQDTRGYMERMP